MLNLIAGILCTVSAVFNLGTGQLGWFAVDAALAAINLHFYFKDTK